MIITCEKCSKNFSINDNLIPETGRLLQCGSCDHKWFYNKPIKKLKLENEVNEVNIDKKNINQEIIKEDKKKNYKTSKKINKKFNFIKIFIVIFISIIALIILIDTFKLQLEKYIPGIKFVLDNLYETLKDFSLFIKDLLIK